MATVAELAQRASDRAVNFTNAFPKPGPGQGVRADKLRAALEAMRPLASAVAKMADGEKKGSFSGAGYLTGPTITADDKAVAGRILYELDTRLPTYGTRPVEPELYAQIKGAAQRLLMIGTDISVTDQWVNLLDRAEQAWTAISDAVVELPETLGKVTGAVVRKVGETAGGLAGGFFSGIGLTGGVVLAGAAVVALLVLRK
jgi:hypothetical protein